jgi:hypothetical protein
MLDRIRKGTNAGERIKKTIHSLLACDLGKGH